MKQTLSPRDLAKAIGVSESSVKRWADEGQIDVSRTRGGHRRIARAEAVRYVREHGLEVVRPELLDLADSPPIPAGQVSEDALSDALFEALRLGETDAAMGLIEAPFLAGRSLAWVFDGPVRRAMHRIGELWQHSADGIFREHRATDICVQALVRLRLILPAPRKDAPVAVGAAPAGDPYLLPSLMVATVLREIGWRDINLGPDTPLSSLEEAVAQCKPSLLWLSISTEAAGEDLRKELPALAERLARAGAALIVGGRTAAALADCRHENLTPVTHLAELAAFARGLQLGRPARTAR